MSTCVSIRRWPWAVAILATTALACSNNNSNPSGPAQALGNPDSLTYLLLPGGPDQPNGVLLSWIPATDPNVTNYIVFARVADTGAFGEVGITLSNSFHTAGTPLPQYYVASEDQFGDVSSGTAIVTIDTAPPLPPPDTVTAVGIDSGAKLHWSANGRAVNPALFAYYRVYSETAVTSNSTTTCPTTGPDFAVEGSSVSEDFVVTGLANDGTTWCYSVTTVTQDGHESVLSQWAMATPNAGGGSFDVVPPNTTVVVHHARRMARARR
jgi:hypothetical protein